MNAQTSLPDLETFEQIVEAHINNLNHYDESVQGIVFESLQKLLIYFHDTLENWLPDIM